MDLLKAGRRPSFDLAELCLDVDCVSKDKAPNCQVCHTNKATVATIDKELGIVRNVCPNHQDLNLAVVVAYV